MKDDPTAAGSHVAPRRGRRILKWTAVGIVVLFLLVWVAIVTQGGAMIKGAINQFGPDALGVPVTVRDVTFRPVRGLVRLRGVHVGNPKGFNTPALFDLQEVTVRLDPLSLLHGPVHIRSIHIKEPVVTYELALGKSNIGTLIDSLGGKESDAKGPPGDKKGKVIIDELVIEGGRVRLSAKVLQGGAVPVPLPRIVLHDIGKDKGGASWSDAATSVLKAVGDIAGQVVTGVGGALLEGVKALGNGIDSLMQ